MNSLNNSSNPFCKNIMPLFHTIWRMSMRGIRVDRRRLDRMGHRLEAMKGKRLAKFLVDAGKPDLNVRSPKQMVNFLYRELGLPTQYSRTTGKPTVDENAINKLVKISKGKFLQGLLDYREVDKLKSTYVDVELDADGRLRTMYSLTGTTTGRLSAKKTIFDTGLNLQNCPPFFRWVIVPDPGNVLVEPDLKQAEFLLTIWYANDAAGKEAMRNGKDPYIWLAAKALHKEERDVTKEERYLFKRVVHGSNYGLGPNHFAEIVGCSKTEAERLQGLYFQAMPSIPAWHADIRQIAATTRTLTNAFGRSRTFLGRLDDDLYRKMYAYLPQSTCVDYINFRLPRIEAALYNTMEAELLLQNHDGFLFQCRPEAVGTSKKIVQDILDEGVVILGDKLVIPIEWKVGKSWGGMRKEKA